MKIIVANGSNVGLGMTELGALGEVASTGTRRSPRPVVAGERGRGSRIGRVWGMPTCPQQIKIV